MIVRGPTIAAGSSFAGNVVNYDFLPTFVDWAGGNLQELKDIDGVNVPGGKTYSWRGFPSTSLRRGDWKLTEFHEDNSVVLFNLRDDPAEQTNLAIKMPERTQQLRTALDAWQKETNAPIPTLTNPECILGDRLHD